jgi:hypothetical protein
MLYLIDVCWDRITPIWGAVKKALARNYAIASLQDNTDLTNINKQKIPIYLAQSR